MDQVRRRLKVQYLSEAPKRSPWAAAGIVCAPDRAQGSKRQGKLGVL